MKYVRKILSILLVFLLGISCFSMLSLADEVFVEGDYEYTVTHGEVTITKYIGEGGDVTIPSTLGGFPITKIGERAFAERKDLTLVVFPNGLTEIGEKAFISCRQLVTIILPNSVTTIGECAFSDCIISEITIPNGVTNIGRSAFSGNAFRSITLPEGITHIEAYTFSLCTNLNQILIPDSVTSIEEYAFLGCDSLKLLIIPESVIALGEYAFWGCNSNIIVSLGTTNIADTAFSYREHIHSNNECCEEILPNRNLTLWGYADTRVYELATEYGIPFVTMTNSDGDILGDVNIDGVVNAADALLALQFSVRLTNNIFSAADMDQNYSINAQDALQILQRSVGL